MLHELREHAPYTLLGTLSGIVLMVLITASGLPRSVSAGLFWTLHPVHVLMSALVTAGLFRLHRRAAPLTTLVVAYVGSVGIATLSDCIIPYVGEIVLALPHRGMHLGFIEKWWFVNPLAIAGGTIGFWFPQTKISTLRAAIADAQHRQAACASGTDRPAEAARSVRTLRNPRQRQRKDAHGG